jgi:hypothetical protein
MTQLVQPADNKTVVFGGSYIVVNCSSNYTYMGGSLNITCFANNSWSQFPNCVWNGGGGGAITTTTTTTMAPSNGAPCTVDMSSTVIIANGYISNMGLTFTTITAATGNHIIMIYFCSYYMFHILGSLQFACGAGYTLDPTIGATYSCINGNWSPKPQCISKLLHFANIYTLFGLILYSDWSMSICAISGIHIQHTWYTNNRYVSVGTTCGQ